MLLIKPWLHWEIWRHPFLSLLTTTLGSRGYNSSFFSKWQTWESDALGVLGRGHRRVSSRSRPWGSFSNAAHLITNAVFLNLSPRSCWWHQQCLLGGHESSGSWQLFSSSFRILVFRILCATDYTQLTLLYGLLLICVESWLCVRHILIPQPNWGSSCHYLLLLSAAFVEWTRNGYFFTGVLVDDLASPSPHPIKPWIWRVAEEGNHERGNHRPPGKPIFLNLLGPLDLLENLMKTFNIFPEKYPLGHRKFCYRLCMYAFYSQPPEAQAKNQYLKCFCYPLQ